MAQGMGLSRLGAEADPSSRDPPKWRTPWESVVKREVGRRLWWNVSQEGRIFFSASDRGTCVIAGLPGLESRTVLQLFE